MDAYLLTFLEQFQHLKIHLEDVKSATNNFDDKNNYIGGGGFGNVYKGEVSHSRGRSMVAIKRLDPKNGQGIPEFLKEITTLSRYTHENLISLLGFCYQGGEMILVYEYASRGSLDRHLNSPYLTWSQRIKICLDAAKGLSYLHDPMETHQRLIHCDVKSANILLDDQWNAKVADFGLSIMGPANELQSIIVTLASGTRGYCDPQYAMTHTLTKESDVYSFGVVLFEVLCGRLCCIYSEGKVQQNLLPTWIESYKQKNLNDIIFKNPTLQPLDQGALEMISDIAYQCLKTSREERPKMAEVITKLMAALENQELLESRKFSEWKAQVVYYEEITKTAEPPLNYNNASIVELWKLLSRGVLLNGGKTWFSLNKKGEHCEMISFAECLVSVPSEFDGWSLAYNSRFAVGSYPYTNRSVEAHVTPRFLSPGCTYTMNLVFKFSSEENVGTGTETEHIEVTYKLDGETETSTSYLAYKREDGWWMCELCQFTSAERTVDLKIVFNGFYGFYKVIQAEGIEFRPLEEVAHKDEKHPILDSDANWEEKLPTDYEYIMNWSMESIQWTTKKEAFSILRKGFLINDGIEESFSIFRPKLINYDKTKRIWFFLDKQGKKCHLLSASVGFEWFTWADMILLPESRFGKSLQSSFQMFTIITKINFHLLSCETTYARYLVYKLPEDQSEFEAPVKVNDLNNSKHYWHIYLVSPQIPVIRLKADQNTHNLVNGEKMKGFPRQRTDGWMEVQIGEFRIAATTGNVDISHKLTACGRTFEGIIIEGVECRPI